MEFDLKQFNRSKFEPRTAKVPVPEFKEFYKGDGEPEWTVRGLTGKELYRVRNSTDRDQKFASVVGALYGNSTEQMEAFKEIFHVQDGAPEEYSKRIEILTIGVVDPELDRTTAVKLAAAFPSMVTAVTDKILGLTSMGHVPGKLKDSGEKDESGTP